MFRAQSFNIVAYYGGSEHRIVKVAFGGDGGIYVHFPSFSRDDGLVGTFTLMPGIPRPTNLNLAESGKVTGHRVKYTHHVDGRAHFSQTGRVRSEVGRQAVPLSSQRGHLFTVQIQALREFASPRQSDRTPKLTFDLNGNFPGLKIVCRRFPLDGMRPLDPETWSANPKGIVFPDGRRLVGLFVAPPEGTPLSENVLLLSPEEWKNTDAEPCVIFLGGFDPPEHALNPSKETSCLALLYPCSDINKLRDRIGTIDLDETAIRGAGSNRAMQGTASPRRSAPPLAAPDRVR